MASETVNAFSWKIQSISEYGIVAYSNKGVFAGNSIIKIVVSNNEAQITGETVGSAIFDLGRNKKNVSAFIAILEEEVNRPDENLSEKYEALKPSFVSPGKYF